MFLVFLLALYYLRMREEKIGVRMRLLSRCHCDAYMEIVTLSHLKQCPLRYEDLLHNETGKLVCLCSKSSKENVILYYNKNRNRLYCVQIDKRMDVHR